MPRPWRAVQLPAGLAERIEAIAARYQLAHAAGHVTLPPEFADRVPLHFVIERAVDCLEGRRRRRALHKALRRSKRPV